LWKSDGTEPGTSQVLNIRSGADSSEPRDFAVLNGAIMNTRKNKPLLFDDNVIANKGLKVKGDVTVGGSIIHSGTLELVSDVETIGDFSVQNGIPGQDVLSVKDRTVSVNGTARYSGSTDLIPLIAANTVASAAFNDRKARIDSNRTATNALYDFIKCVHTLSSVTGYVESNDFADCWNIWIAGKVTAVP
jgi:hypothetical protein